MVLFVNLWFVICSSKTCRWPDWRRSGKAGSLLEIVSYESFSFDWSSR